MAFGGFDSPVFLAPMAGVTDRPFRQVITACGKGNMYAEMAAINALQRKNPKSWQIADVRAEKYPVVVQLVGNDAGLFAEAAKLVADLGARSLDINMGCPAPKVAMNGGGSALMKDPVLAEDITRAVVGAVDKPVTVKIRTGWDKNHLTAVELAKRVEDAGAAAVTVHGRTREQQYAPPVDYETIGRVKQALHIPVIGNGDITDTASAQKMLNETGCDYLMVGRAAMGNPFIFAELNAFFTGQPIPTVSLETRLSVLLKQVDLMEQYKGTRVAMLEARKHTAWYLRGLPGAAALRRDCGCIESKSDIEKICEKALEHASRV